MSDIRVAFVMATWHDDLVDRTKLGFFERMAELGHGDDAIDVHKLPGALEFPLHCKKLWRRHGNGLHRHGNAGCTKGP